MRLDRELVARGLVRSRTRAQSLIGAGRVMVNGRVADKPSAEIGAADELAVDDDIWVSRAAHKLLGALAESGARVPSRVLDAGASTGGFTQVLLTHGATRVYAVDVGHDQLADELRDDSRVVVREGLNLRDLTLADVDDEPVRLVVADVSFISLTLLVEPLFGVLAPDGEALLMVKPQFEVGRERLGTGGVVSSETDRREAVDRVSRLAEDLGWRERWRGVSRLPGPAGNLEYFVHLVSGSVG